MKKILMLLLLGMFLISFASAEAFKINEELDIKVVCLNDGYCSSEAFCNINVIDPDSLLIVTGQNMTNQTSFHNYTITPNRTGTYKVEGFCKDGDESEEININLQITPNGESLSTSGGILYSLFSIILFGIICIVSFFLISLPSENEKDDEGFATKVIRLKYLRPILIVALYMLLILLLNFLTGISVNFSTLSMFSGILGFLFEIMVRLSWPFTVLIIAWIVYMLIKDTNINKQLDKLDKFDPFK